MADKQEAFVEAALQSQEKSLEQLDRLFEAARPQSIFGEPVAVADSQVLTASETLTTIGFGFGLGGGEAPVIEPEAQQSAEQENESPGGAGGGGGGGGMSTGRPVAVVRIDADGVTVEPIVDVTKIALAAFTALGTMFFMFGKMAKRP